MRLPASRVAIDDGSVYPAYTSIVAIPRTGFAFQTRCEFLSLLLAKVFDRFVVSVKNNRKIQTQAQIDIFESRSRKASSCRDLNPAGSEVRPDALLKFVLSQPGNRRNSNRITKVFQFGSVPVSVVELLESHCRRKFRLRFHLRISVR